MKKDIKIDEQQLPVEASGAATVDVSTSDQEANISSTAVHGDKALKSPGEKKFEMITYKGIGWLATAGLGIGLAQLLEHGKGRAVFDKSIEYFTPKYQKLMGVSEKVAHDAVSSGLTHTSFIAGASTLVYPIKKLEDNKTAIVEKFDREINEKRSRKGDDPTSQELDVQEKAHARLRAESKQTWPSILVGRALGVSTVFFPAIFLIKGKDKKLLENIAEKVIPNKQVQSLGVLTALEVGYSFISEEVLHFTSQMYAKSKQTPTEIALQKKVENPQAMLEQIDSVQSNQAYQALSLKA